MREVFLDHLSFALGSRSSSVDEAAEMKRIVSNASALKDAGFAVHRWSGPTETAYDLARQAVAPIASALGGIDAILYSTCIPANGNIGREGEFGRTRDVKHLMDFPASHLQSDFNLDRASVMGLNQQACTGMLGSLRLARALIASEPEVERVLCVTADRFPEGALYEQSFNLISDGAAACIVSAVPSGFRLLATHAITNGAMSRSSDDETVGSFFTYTHRTIREALEKAGLSIDEIDWIVAQNTNATAWQILARLLKFDFEKIYFHTIAEVGHVISGDNVINLKHLDDEQNFVPGQRALLVMAGYGLNWQCAIIEKV